MDRDALVERNRLLAEAFHATPMRYKLRGRMLEAVAATRFTPQVTKPMRVLFIRPDHIGDMLLATPAIRALKDAQPFAQIHVLAGPWAAPILNSYDEIQQVLTIRFPGFDRNANRKQPFAPYTQLLRVSRQLRAIGYSAAVIMRSDHWWGAMLAHVAGIPEIIGYDLPDVSPFLTRKLPFQTDHAVRQNLRLVEHWTGKVADSDVNFDLPLLPSDEEFVTEWLSSLNITPSQRLLCIHAGAGTWVKQWDASRWAHVADTLHEQHDLQVIFTGSSSERALITQITAQAQHTHINEGGVLSLGQLAALYSHSRIVVGCDSGPLHIAAAVKTPTVALFGPANPIEFGQWGDRQKYLILSSTIGCRPCRVLDWGDDAPANHPCMRDISINDVLAAATRVLNS